MYHPPDLGTNDNTRDEFVELYNPTPAAIPLQDTNGQWRIDGGIGFTFPPNTTLPAGGTLLLVNFNPADTAALATFRSVYRMTNSTPLFGPYTGKLGNRSDRVALEKPLYPDLPGDPYSWAIVDEVIYGNQNPWPTNANGAGYALQRLSLTRSGNDPVNWGAGLPTPGRASSVPADTDGDGMPDWWELAYNLNPYSPNDAQMDADGDGMSNLAEFLSGTDPRNASSRLAFDSVAISSGVLTLGLTALQDRSYTVQFLPDVTSTRWEKLADISAGAQRQVTVNDLDSPGYSHRYYRLVTPALP
jgi:hypothetical protein